MPVDVDEMQTTRGEKLLSLVLAVFLLIGGIWAYDKLADEQRPYEPEYTRAERAAITQHSKARKHSLRRARRGRAGAPRQLELAREEYRTALDADLPAHRLAAQYRREQREFRDAEATLTRAQERERTARPPADAARRRGYAEADDERRADEWLAFGLRLVLLLALLAASFYAFTKARGSRYVAVASSGLMAATALAAIMAFDYIENYVEWQGPRAARPLARRRRALAARVLGAPPAPGPADPDPARAQGRVPVLRLPGTRRALRGLRARDRRAVHLVRVAPTRGHASLRRVREGLTGTIEPWPSRSSTAPPEAATTAGPRVSRPRSGTPGSPRR